MQIVHTCAAQSAGYAPPCHIFFIVLRKTDPEDEHLSGRPSHPERNCGDHHPYTSSYCIGSASGTETRKVDIIFLSWRAIGPSTVTSDNSTPNPRRPPSSVQERTFLIKCARPKKNCYNIRNNEAPPQEGTRSIARCIARMGP